MVSFKHAVPALLSAIALALNGVHAASIEARATTPAANYNGVATYNWCGTSKMIALGFDGGTSANNEQLLADLERLGMKVTYFISGFDTPPDEGDCEMIKKIISKGHEIQHHSWTHPSFLTISTSEAKSQISNLENLIYNTCKIKRKMTQFRPPFGEFDNKLAKMVNKLGYVIASWTYDSEDNLKEDATTIFNRVKNLHAQLPKDSSAVILHHDDTYYQGASLGILEKYKNYFKGYKFVTAEECYQACLAEDACVAPNDSWPGVFA